MNCRYYRRIIEREANREITERERRALVIHLTWCERCAARRESTARSVGEVRSALLEVPRVEVVGRVMARVFEAVPALVRRDRVSPRQFAYSVVTATAIAAAFAAVILLRAPGVARQTPVDRLAFWTSKLLAGASRLVVETVQFLAVTLADGLRLLRYLNTVQSQWPILGPLHIVLVAVLIGTVLATTTVLVRRDLARTRSGIH